MDLQGKRALVTGASRGIGRAVALALGAHGARVSGTATTQDGAAAIANALEQAGIDGLGLVLDAASGESVKNLREELKKRDIYPDILVNNAGITRDKLLMRMDEETWNSVIETNLKSVYRLSKICVRSMSKAGWGRIINITSISGLMGNAGQCNYAAAKAGIIGFTKSLAHEVASRGITVNCVAPGFVDTDMVRALPEDTRNALIQRIPMQRFAKPTEVAHAVLMLADDNGAYITGETICVAGGLYMQ